jgi:flagellar biosynthesis/type III secretory pathway ATPase
LLADAEEPLVITGATRKVGVHGMVGIGKSVLAAALAQGASP